MSYILANDKEEKIIAKLKTVMTEKKLQFAHASAAQKQSQSYVKLCNKAKVNPLSENTQIAWTHIIYRYLRGLI
jgi:hypothetical protein